MGSGFIRVIGYFYFYLAVLLFLSVLNLPQLAIRFEPNLNLAHGFPFIPETILRTVLIVFLLVTAYGILKLKRWGYRTLFIYSLYLAIVGLYMYSYTHETVYVGNVLFNAVVIYVLRVNRGVFANTVH